VSGSKSPPTLEGEAAMQIHLVTCARGQGRLRNLVERQRHSGYRTGDPGLARRRRCRRHRNPCLGADYDTTMDRHARLAARLGLCRKILSRGMT